MVTIERTTTAARIRGDLVAIDGLRISTDGKRLVDLPAETTNLELLRMYLFASAAQENPSLLSVVFE